MDTKYINTFALRSSLTFDDSRYNILWKFEKYCREQYILEIFFPNVTEAMIDNVIYVTNELLKSINKDDDMCPELITTIKFLNQMKCCVTNNVDKGRIMDCRAELLKRAVNSMYV